MRALLAERRPDDGILGEEFGAQAGQLRADLGARSDRRHPRVPERRPELGHPDRARRRRRARCSGSSTSPTPASGSWAAAAARRCAATGWSGRSGARLRRPRRRGALHHLPRDRHAPPSARASTAVRDRVRHDALRLRLLRLCADRARPGRPGDRGGAPALRHPGAAGGDRGGGRHRHRLAGRTGAPRRPGAGGGRRAHAAGCTPRRCEPACGRQVQSEAERPVGVRPRAAPGTASERSPVDRSAPRPAFEEAVDGGQTPSRISGRSMQHLVPRAVEHELALLHPRDLAADHAGRDHRLVGAEQDQHRQLRQRRDVEPAPSPRARRRSTACSGRRAPSSGWAVSWRTIQAKCSGSEVSALPSKPTASAVGCGLRARHQPRAEADAGGELGRPCWSARGWRCASAGATSAPRAPRRRSRRARAGCAGRCRRPSNARRDSAARAGRGSASSASSAATSRW